MTATASAQYGDFTYVIDNNTGDAIITGYAGLDVEVTLPAKIQWWVVRAISASAFSGNTSLTSVTIPATVTSIGNLAFQSCTSLKSIVIESSTLLESGLLITSYITSIGTSAFSGCISLTSVLIPGGVSSIGTGAFQSCSNLTTVTLYRSVGSIGSDAFRNCPLLTELNVWGNAPSVGAAAFTGSPLTVFRLTGTTKWSSTLGGASVIEVQTDLTYTITNCEVTITGTTGTGGALQIPARILGVPVRAIGRSAFRDKANLTSVAIPSSVTSIGDSAFYSCVGFSTVVIPAGVTSIGNGAFGGCSGLIGVTLASTVSSIGSWAFAGCTSLTGISLTNGLRSIDMYAFKGCTALASVTLPSTVTQINVNAFDSCSSLATVSLSASLTSLSMNLFVNCTSLTKITIPNKVVGIAANAFAGCSSLASVTIPSSVTNIQPYAFARCTGLETVLIPSSVTVLAGGAFSSCTKLTSVTVQSGNQYYASIDGVVYNKSLTQVVAFPGARGGAFAIPSTVTSIAFSAFDGCSNLLRVVLPSKLVSIGSYAFRGCVGLNSLSVPASLASIETGVFQSCSSLKEVYFQGYSPTVGTDAFLDCPATLYRLATYGWPSTLAGRPVEVFQPMEVAAGQTVTVSIASGVARIVKQGAGVVVLDAGNSHAGGTVVEAGELVVRNRNALGLGMLDVRAGAKVTIQTGYETVLVTRVSLTDTSRLELGTGRLSVSAGGFNESEIRAKLIAGRNGGLWNGATGITSSAAGGDRTIGYRVVEGSLEVAWAAPGDTNLDGGIDILDLANILGSGSFNTGTPTNWEQGDANYDGVLDVLDLSELLGAGLFNTGTYLAHNPSSVAVIDQGNVGSFDLALVFAAVANGSSEQTSVRRKLPS